MKTPRKYQKVGIEFLRSNYHALLADDMGVGKTFQAAKALPCAFISVLVICPNTVKNQWKDELISCWFAEEDIAVINKREDKIKRITIINYDKVIRDEYFEQLKSKYWDYLICDEAHYLKALDSQRSQKILGVGGIVYNCKYKWMLTGTPIQNKPVEFYPLLSTLFPEVIHPYNKFEDFAVRFCGGHEVVHRSFREFVADGASNLEDLHARVQHIMLRRTKEEVVKELPNKIEQSIYIDCNDWTNTALTDYESWCVENEKEPNTSTVRRLVGLGKASAVARHVRDIVESTGEKVVLFGYHRDVLAEYKKGLTGIKTVTLIGGMNDREREEVKNKFLNDPGIKVFIGNIEAAGTGLDGLQRVSSIGVFGEEDWNPKRKAQAVDRLFRIGQTGSRVLIQTIRMRDTIDVPLDRVMENKSRIVDTIIK